MRLRFCLPALALLLAAEPVRAAVIVVGNYTNVDVTFGVAEPGAKAREHKIPSNGVMPVAVSGPADVTFTANGRAVTLRVQVYHAYVFLPDPPTAVRTPKLTLPIV